MTQQSLSRCSSVADYFRYNYLDQNAIRSVLKPTSNVKIIQPKFFTLCRVSSITNNVNTGIIPGMSIRPYEAFRSQQESTSPTL